jgi:AcrR family transcriptional regulator
MNKNVQSDQKQKEDMIFPSYEEHIDRRIVRTKEAIRETLIELIKEKGFDAITVQDISTRANINRGTFYLHYRDKYDLLEQIENEIIRDYMAILSSQLPDAQDVKDLEEPLPFVVAVFEYLYDRADLMRVLLGFTGDIAFQVKIKKALEENIFKIGLFASIKKENLRVPFEYLVAYLASANLGVIQTWLQKGCQESPKEMAHILFRLTLSGPIYASGVK